MGTRNTLDPGTEKVYEAAAKWVECALRANDSLFTPGVPIWSKHWLEELRYRFLNQPDELGANFIDKLAQQLANSPPEIYQLMGEVLYFHFLIVSTKNGANEKRVIETVLRWSPNQVSISQEFAGALTPGIAHPGRSFYSNRPYQLGFLIEFVEQWKELSSAEQGRLLANPWGFKDFATRLLLRSRLMKDSGYRHWTQLEALLHLVFPDTFEAVVSGDHKEKIADAFSSHIIEPTDDIDRKLAQIRPALENKYGVTGNHLYYDKSKSEVPDYWGTNPKSVPWDKYVSMARGVLDTIDLDATELDYKVDISRKLADAREAVLASSSEWPELLKKGMIGNIVHPIQLARFRDWVGEHSEEALGALKALWTKGDLPITNRINSFISLFPHSATGTRGAGTRMNVVSQLLMAVDVENYPPFRVTFFEDAYRRTGYLQPGKDAGEVALYEHALDFLDRFIDEAGARELYLPNRLYAQSVAWMIPYVEGKNGNGDNPAGGKTKSDLAALAQGTYLTEKFLEDIVELLEDKKQVIFQGPPGTGKTYVAQALAECLAGAKERVTLVQFHPSYAYEDFVQGFRPRTLDSGQPGFALQDGPLIRAASEAIEDPEEKHFLVIDEINRGNLAKVFGELYFLLEYRNREMALQYTESPFSLPDNLYIIGTMNTADRSIALVDLTLRRRFHFVEFHPDDEPVKNVLRRYLGQKAPGMEWVADVVERANVQLQKDRDAAIGPSYFMKDNLNEDSVQRIWKHNVLPYIAELLHGQPERLKGFNLDALRRPSASDSAPSDNAERGDPASDPEGQGN